MLGDKLHNPVKFKVLTDIFNAGHSGPKYEILFQTDMESEAFDREIHIIREYRNRFKMTNLAKGGVGGQTCFPHRMLGAKLNRRWRDNISKAKMGKPSHRKGAKLRPDTIAKIKRNRSLQTGLNEPRLIHLTDEQIKTILKERENGLSTNSIALLIGVNKLKISKTLVAHGKYIPIDMVKTVKYGGREVSVADLATMTGYSKRRVHGMIYHGFTPDEIVLKSKGQLRKRRWHKRPQDKNG